MGPLLGVLWLLAQGLGSSGQGSGFGVSGLLSRVTVAEELGFQSLSKSQLFNKDCRVQQDDHGPRICRL